MVVRVGPGSARSRGQRRFDGDRYHPDHQRSPTASAPRERDQETQADGAAVTRSRKLYIIGIAAFTGAAIIWRLFFVR
jgi:hypothetical protein